MEEVQVHGAIFGMAWAAAGFLIVELLDPMKVRTTLRILQHTETRAAKIHLTVLTLAAGYAGPSMFLLYIFGLFRKPTK